MNKDSVYDGKFFRQGSVSLYAGGVQLSSPIMKPGNPAGKGGGVRSEIKGWSTASRRRMREFMLTHDAPGIDLHGVTLTMPGPAWAIGPDLSKRVFNRFGILLQRASGCAVWRLEIQQRGSLHWHLLGGFSEGSGSVPDRFRNLWLSSLSSVGEISIPESIDSKEVYEIGEVNAYQGFMYLRLLRWGAILKGRYSPDEWARIAPYVSGGVGARLQAWPDLALWPGAGSFACHAEADDGKGAWLRYMQDHATKAKQEQIAVNVGRHWGVIGRKRFAQVLPDSVYALSQDEYAKVRRWYERLATPRRPNPKAPFGRSLGFRCSRGRRGRAVCFSNPATIERMIQYAKGAL